MNYRCLIVDDEPLARSIIKTYLRRLPGFSIADEFGSAEAAAEYLKRRRVDVLFLDVRMHGMTGLGLLDIIDQPPPVILTTAYSQYAIKGYDYSVVDFLLKPFSFERFHKAVEKLLSATYASASTRQSYAFMRAGNTDCRVKFSEIRYVEAYGNYMKIFLESEMLLVSGTMQSMEDLLPNPDFIRIHRSFIVSVNHIDQITSDVIVAGDAQLPIGRSYKREALRRIESLKTRSFIHRSR